MKRVVTSYTEFPEAFVRKQQEKENNITININLLSSDDLIALRSMLYAANQINIGVDYSKYLKEINERILWLEN